MNLTNFYRSVTDKLSTKPSHIFLLDSTGAAITIFFLSVVLTNFQTYFGLPQNVLYNLSAIALLFVAYSFSCFLVRPSNRQLYLKIVAVANACYCLLIAAVVVYYYPLLTGLGVLYFFLESVVIIALVSIEWTLATAPLKHG